MTAFATMPLSQKQLLEVLSAWQISGPCEKIQKTENEVYKLSHGSKNYFLRINRPNYRTEAELQTEVQWLEFLKTNGLPVGVPQRSKNNRLLEPVPQIKTQRFASLFEQAPGRPFNRDQDFNGPTIELFGKTLARLHRLTVEFTQNSIQCVRRKWHEEPHFTLIAKLREPSDALAFSLYDDHLGKLNSFPTTSESFGLVHADLHGRNVLITESELSVIDFDDACFHWYGYDLAVTLSQFLQIAWEQGKDSTWCQKALLRGYQKQAPLPPQIKEQLPEFLIHRSLLLFYWAKQIGMNPPTEGLKRWSERMAEFTTKQLESLHKA